MIARFIPHADVETYRQKGWRISPLPMPHGFYSSLATRPDRAWERVANWFRMTWDLIR